MSEMFFTSTASFREGDILSIDVPTNRKWWQLWRLMFAPRKYRVTSVYSSTVYIERFRLWHRLKRWLRRG